MNKKIKDILEEIKYQLTDKKSEFYAIIIFIIILMLLFYPIPFILLQKTTFKYTGHLYILTICLYLYFSIIHQEKDIENDFLHIFKLLEKVLPCIMACIIVFCIGPLFWALIFLHGKSEYRQSYIYAFPDKDYAKSYRVRADLDYDSELETGFQVSKIYFDNGGYIEFDFCEDENKKGDLFYCEAINDDREWYFRYYGEKVEN